MGDPAEIGRESILDTMQRTFTDYPNALWGLTMSPMQQAHTSRFCSRLRLSCKTAWPFNIALHWGRGHKSPGGKGRRGGEWVLCIPSGVYTGSLVGNKMPCHATFPRVILQRVKRQACVPPLRFYCTYYGTLQGPPQSRASRPVYSK